MSKVRQFEDEMNLKLAECDQWDKQIQETIIKLDDSKKVYKTLLKKVNQGIVNFALIYSQDIRMFFKTNTSRKRF